jgi:hypothetical protein
MGSTVLRTLSRSRSRICTQLTARGHGRTDGWLLISAPVDSLSFQTDIFGAWVRHAEEQLVADVRRREFINGREDEDIETES